MRIAPAWMLTESHFIKFERVKICSRQNLVLNYGFKKGKCIISHLTFQQLRDSYLLPATRWQRNLQLWHFIRSHFHWVSFEIQFQKLFLIIHWTIISLKLLWEKKTGRRWTSMKYKIFINLLISVAFIPAHTVFIILFSVLGEFLYNSLTVCHIYIDVCFYLIVIHSLLKHLLFLNCSLNEIALTIWPLL